MIYCISLFNDSKQNSNIINNLQFMMKECINIIEFLDDKLKVLEKKDSLNNSNINNQNKEMLEIENILKTLKSINQSYKSPNIDYLKQIIKIMIFLKSKIEIIIAKPLEKISEYMPGFLDDMIKILFNPKECPIEFSKSFSIFLVKFKSFINLEINEPVPHFILNLFDTLQQYVTYYVFLCLSTTLLYVLKNNPNYKIPEEKYDSLSGQMNSILKQILAYIHINDKITFFEITDQKKNNIISYYNSILDKKINLNKFYDNVIETNTCVLMTINPYYNEKEIKDLNQKLLTFNITDQINIHNILVYVINVTEIALSFV